MSMTRRIRQLAGVTGGAVLILLLAGAANGQVQPKYKMDPSAPLAFSSDSQDLSTKTCITVLRGRAEVSQDRTRLRANTLTATQDKSGSNCSDIVRIEAQGNVFYVTPDQNIRADKAVYDPKRETATFNGNVIAVQGKDVTATDNLTINTTTGEAQLVGRVRGVIYPNRSPGQAK